MSGYLLPKDLQPRSDVKTTKENVKDLARVFKRSIKLGLVHSYSPLIIDVMDEIVSSKGKCKFEKILVLRCIATIHFCSSFSFFVGLKSYL